MNAEQVFIHGVGDTRLEAVAVPDEPGAGEVLIETECSFISAGTELSAYIGTRPAASWDGAVAKYPSAPGYANAGRVLAAGSAVEGIIPGDRVFSFGRHASHHLQAQDGGNHAMLLGRPGRHPGRGSSSLPDGLRGVHRPADQRCAAQ
jgi:NADPH:quinone reductase-like Zn-dependent oxidoreductase